MARVRGARRRRKAVAATTSVLAVSAGAFAPGPASWAETAQSSSGRDEAGTSLFEPRACGADVVEPLSQDVLDAAVEAGILGFRPLDPENPPPEPPELSPEWAEYEERVLQSIAEANARQAELPPDSGPVPIEEAPIPESAVPELAAFADEPTHGCHLSLTPESGFRDSRGVGSPAPADVESLQPNGAEASPPANGPESNALLAYNGTESMRVYTPPLPTTVDSNQMEWMFWIASPQNQETNTCDGAASPGCIWFSAANIDFRHSNGTLNGCATHFGPIRGDEHGTSWNINFGLTCPGYTTPHVATGTGINTGTWYRVQLVRTQWYSLWGAAFSDWNLYLTSGSWNQLLGSATYPGKDFNGVVMFNELIEQDDVCHTDFDNIHVDEIKSRLNTTVLRHPTGSIVAESYENNCSNTTFIDNNTSNAADQHYSALRENSRLVLPNYTLWQGAK